MHALLSILIWLPIAAGLGVVLLGDRHLVAARWLALLASLATLALSVPLWRSFDTASAALQFREKLPWIPRFDAWYALGVDGISLPLIVLTAFMTVPVVIAGWRVIETRPAQYYAAFLIMEGLMIGVFSATDALLFYFFWEAMLIPMFLIIGIWGGPRRVYATIKFFLYTFLGWVFMLAALIYMYVKGGSYAIASLQALPLTLIEQRWIFLALLLAFAVKVPMFPVHTWLPDAHVEAPTGGSVILAAIMLKMGGYGFLRFSLPVTPDASRELDLLVIAAFMVLFALANTGLPGTSGFVGEFLVIIASFRASFWYSALAAVTLVLGAAYTLWLVKRVIFGPVTSPRVAALEDLNGREYIVLTALALAVLLVGVWPAPLLKVMQPSIEHLVSQAIATKL